MVKDKILRIFIRQLRKEFGNHLKKIILFGSRARGDNAKESDYDLLLIFDKVTPVIKDKILDIEGEVGYTYNVVFSAFPFTDKDLYRKRYSPFIMNANREGVLL